MINRLIFTLCISLFCSAPLWAQNNFNTPTGPIEYEAIQDTLKSAKKQAVIQGYTPDGKVPEGDLNEPAVREYKNVPIRAAMYSAAVPGLGQIYNKKYWKLPIIYGGGIAIGYFIAYNDQYYQLFRTAAFDSANGVDNPLADNFTLEQLEQRADIAQRNREWSMVFMVALYALQIVDAHVDSHLRDFEITPDLAMGVRPSLLPTLHGVPAPGLTVNFTFK
ncbi:DUF5683 domain-containing protein [Persicobacter diffluens]|uniref:DUF5683 domain-containing protein n=1 Tax=Persicobacter diffluens TaxID=981 RepID=A0AAN4VUW3_9BACT|nr:hypothetical protein PEDI_09480 [Persicobacter diffluens]